MGPKIKSVLFATIFVLLGHTLFAQTKSADGWYESAFDTAFVWLPEEIHIIWPEMKLTLKLPDEKDRSGVANLLFRDRKSGKIHLLDTVKESPAYNSKSQLAKDIAHIKEARCYYRFEHGNYDAILLYNNGNYIVYDNIALQNGMNMVVDLEGQPVRATNRISKKWLALRKFTDIVGQRTILKNYETRSPNKVLGYVFDSGTWALSSIFIRSITNSDRASLSSYDGYFELDVDDYSTLEISYPGYESINVGIKPNIGLFILVNPVNLDDIDLRSTPLIKKQ